MSLISRFKSREEEQRKRKQKAAAQKERARSIFAGLDAPYSATHATQTSATSSSFSENLDDFERRLNREIEKMLEAGATEREIAEYIENQSKALENSIEIPSETHTVTISRGFNSKDEFREALELYFRNDIETARQNKSPEEFAQIKAVFDHLIDTMLELSEEDLEKQLDIIDNSRKKISQNNKSTNPPSIRDQLEEIKLSIRAAKKESQPSGTIKR